jgi:hypothetical protein
MRGVARSFWVLVAIAAAAEAFLGVLAVDSLDHVLPCWWTSTPSLRPSTASCGQTVAFFGYHSWVPASVILVFVATTLAIGIWTLLAQLFGTGRALRQLGAPVASPPSLAHSAATLGIDVALIDDARCFCCTAGFFSPRVIISTEMVRRLDSNQLTAVLAHERAHVQRRDPARAAAVRVASRALFYLPLASHLADKSLVASELGADSSATSIAGEDALVGALLQVLWEVRPALGSATEMASLDALDSRIEALQTKQLPKIWPSLWIVSPSVVAAGIFCAMSLWLPPVVPVLHAPPVHTLVHSHPGAMSPLPSRTIPTTP